jgi:hypothetical protein
MVGLRDRLGLAAVGGDSEVGVEGCFGGIVDGREVPLKDWEADDIMDGGCADGVVVGVFEGGTIVEALVWLLKATLQSV